MIPKPEHPDLAGRPGVTVIPAQPDIDLLAPKFPDVLDTATRQSLHGRAFIFSTGADTAGCSERLAKALSLHREDFGWQARAMVSMTNYIDYPIDLPYSVWGLMAAYRQADLVQMNSTMHGHNWYDQGLGKPTVLMHHGWHTGHFAKDIHGCVAEGTEIGATQVGSTVNLELLAPLGPPGPKTVTWTPTPYDLWGLQAMRQALYQPHPDGVIRVGHAPTNRAIKSTEAFISAMNSLKSRGFPVEMVLIEQQTHAKTMEIKAKHVEIFVDQLNLGYGCNAIEAWGLGLPVIGAVNEHPDWREHMIRRFDCKESLTGLPFYEATEQTLEKAILTLVESRRARLEWAIIGGAHAFRHHDNKVVAKLVSEIYDEAVKLPTTPSTGPLPPIRGNHGERVGHLRVMRQLQLQLAKQQPTTTTGE